VYVLVVLGGKKFFEKEKGEDVMKIHSVDDFVLFLRKKKKIVLSSDEKRSVARARKVFENLIKKQRVYGANTGVGALLDVNIGLEKMAEFQANLISSHTCGVGKPVSDEIARGTLLLLINTLKGGYSGVSLGTLYFLVCAFNSGKVPVIPETGSLGASGDLVPLAHLVSSLEDYERNFFEPGEVIFLLNGTHFSTSVFAHVIYETEKLVELADLAAAMTVAVLGASEEPFGELANSLANRFGQIHSAAATRKFLGNYKLTAKRKKLQDGYSLRCTPQVHGSVREAVGFAKKTVNDEINSVSFNPFVLSGAGGDTVCCGGNFHAQPLAIAADTLGIALATLANISERRTERMLNPVLSGLPAFLSREPGVDSGLMIAQYTAAALIARNKVLVYPASIGSVPVSASQEDFVSMAVTAGMKAREILENTRYVLAIELLCAARAFEFNGNPMERSALKKLRTVRNNCPSGDISRSIEGVYQLIKNEVI